MNITNVIKTCGYGSPVKFDTADIYQNNELLQAINYSADDNDVCLGLQTSFNLFSGIESGGSSYKYTIPHLQSNGSIMQNINEHEYFGIDETFSKIDPIHLYLTFIILVIMCMIYVKHNELE